MYLVVVGAIGCGKSTLIKSFSTGVKVLESTDKWKKSGILEDFYKDPRNNAFKFQLSVFNDYVDNVDEALQSNPSTLVVERSMHCQPLFWGLQPQKKGEDEVYRSMWAKWSRLIPEPTHYIFLDTDDVDTLLERISDRGRPGEDGVSHEYQRKLIAAHKAFYTREKFGDRLIVLDALNSVEENVRLVNEILKF